MGAEFGVTSYIELLKLKNTGKISMRAWLKQRNKLPKFPPDPISCIMPTFDDFPYNCSLGGRNGEKCPAFDICTEKVK